jgi:hypothetical protein
VQRRRSFTLEGGRGLLLVLFDSLCGLSTSSLVSVLRLPSRAVIAVRKLAVSLIGGDVIEVVFTGTLSGEGECDEGIWVVCLSCSTSAAVGRVECARLGVISGDHEERPNWDGGVDPGLRSVLDDSGYVTDRSALALPAGSGPEPSTRMPGVEHFDSVVDSTHSRAMTSRFLD